MRVTASVNAKAARSRGVYRYAASCQAESTSSRARLLARGPGVMVVHVEAYAHPLILRRTDLDQLSRRGSRLPALDVALQPEDRRGRRGVYLLEPTAVPCPTSRLLHLRLPVLGSPRSVMSLRRQHDTEGNEHETESPDQRA